MNKHYRRIRKRISNGNDLFSAAVILLSILIPLYAFGPVFKDIW